MPAPAIAIGLYELALLAAATLGVMFLQSPPVKDATRDAARDAARAAAEALERARQSSKQPKKKPDDRPPPPIDPLPPTATQDCPKEKEKESCPVCGIGENPTPGVIPPYVSPPRAPKVNETIPPLNSFKRTEMICKGARVYEGPTGNYYHVDTLHKGQGAEIEAYDSSERHLGAMCPHCGTMKPNSKVEGRNLKRCK